MGEQSIKFQTPRWHGMRLFHVSCSHSIGCFKTHALPYFVSQIVELDAREATCGLLARSLTSRLWGSKTLHSRTTARVLEGGNDIDIVLQGSAC